MQKENKFFSRNLNNLHKGAVNVTTVSVMFNRVKSVIANAVGGLDNIQSTHHENGISALTPKFTYGRPHFLNLNLTEEVPLSADHRVRPIIVPRERDALPWYAGYAECVNSGKSQKNEDQATAYEFNIGPLPSDNNASSIVNGRRNIQVNYFGMFDGHAGYGAAVCAAKQLHYIIEEKLLDVAPQIWTEAECIKTISQSKDITKDALVIGALERSFIEMDQLIAEDRDKYLSAGGCTALVILFVLGRVYIANAGDSRAIRCVNSKATPLSFDFTPESERRRIRMLAEMKPELLNNEYTCNEYQHEPKYMDLGKPIFYRDAFMTGWAMKTISKDDLKMPVVTGEGKRSRVMNTIGVTRGFGDHDLRAVNSRILIKPFLSAHPEVLVLNLNEMNLTDEDVIVMATDGLWDVTSNEKAAEIVDRILIQFKDEKHKYISAAQALVAHARGKPLGESSWRTSEGKAATGDDVSVFVVPLLPYKNFYYNYQNNVHNSPNQTMEINFTDDNMLVGND